jgi:hypothetical protein
MSAIPPPADPVAASDGASAAPRQMSAKRRRLLVLAAALLCLIGTGGYVKWSAMRDETNTRNVRALLATDGIAVIDSAGVPDESASPFQSWSAPKVVRVQSSTNRITDAELPKIAGISQDLNLILSSCPITNEGLSSLEGKHNICCLTLTQTGVTDEGIKHLRGMNLQSLDLSSTKITDAGLATLGEFDFPRLKEVAIERTRVTNTGLMHLANFKALEWVSISGTKVTKDGIRHLKAKLPEATILGGGG